MKQIFTELLQNNSVNVNLLTILSVTVHVWGIGLHRKHESPKESQMLYTLGYCCTNVETMSAKLVFTELMVVCNITAQNYVNSTNYQHF